MKWNTVPMFELARVELVIRGCVLTPSPNTMYDPYVHAKNDHQ